MDALRCAATMRVHYALLRALRALVVGMINRWARGVCRVASGLHHAMWAHSGQRSRQCSATFAQACSQSGPAGAHASVLLLNMRFRFSDLHPSTR